MSPIDNSLFASLPIYNAAVLFRWDFRNPGKYGMPISFLVTVSLVAFPLGICIIDFWASVSKGCSSPLDISVYCIWSVIVSWPALNIQPHSERYAKGFWAEYEDREYKVVILAWLLRFLYRRGPPGLERRCNCGAPLLVGMDFPAFLCRNVGHDRVQVQR